MWVIRRELANIQYVFGPQLRTELRRREGYWGKGHLGGFAASVAVTKWTDGWNSVALYSVWSAYNGPSAGFLGLKRAIDHHTHSGFLDLSQLSRASLLKAAVAALLLLLRWILAMVSEFFTTSMSPILFPVDKQPYGIILWVWGEMNSVRLVWKSLLCKTSTAAAHIAVPEIQAFFLP